MLFNMIHTQLTQRIMRSTLLTFLLVSTAYSTPAADPQIPDGTDFGAPSTSTVTGWTGSASSSYGYDPAAGFPTGDYILPPANFNKVRVAHAVIMSCAVLILFPAGGIIIRVLNHHHIVWIHAAFQMIAWVFYVAGAGMGIYLARNIFQVGGFHPIIGLLLLCLFTIQPLSETINHFLYHRFPRILFLGYIHIWLGRILIVLAIINGGLGFVFADSFPGPRWPAAPRIAYGVVATVVSLTYLAVMWLYQMKTLRRMSRDSTAQEVEGLRGEQIQSREGPPRVEERRSSALVAELGGGGHAAGGKDGVVGREFQPSGAL